jgi:hypothetical protein
MEQTYQIDRGIIRQAAKSLRGKEKGLSPDSRLGWPVRLIRWGLALILIFFFFTVGVHLGNDPNYSRERAENFLGIKMPRLASLAGGGPEKSTPFNPAAVQLKRALEAREGGESD